jgi:exodeoxyribonuclease V alpha subunit
MTNQTLQVKIKHIRYRKEGSDWSILETDKGVVKGEIPWTPQVGENITISGKYESYRGEKQFAFLSAKAVIPEDPKGMLVYACELTTGLGPAMAEKMWERAGEDWQELKAGDVPGFTENKYEAFVEVVELMTARADQSKAIAFLLGKGCSINLAKKAWKHYEASTIPKVTADPYVLADLPKEGFSKIDGTIRHSFGIQDTDDVRLRAGVKYQLTESLKGGGSYVILEPFLADCINLLCIDKGTVTGVIRSLLADGIFSGFPAHRAITFPQIRHDEEVIWNYIK